MSRIVEIVSERANDPSGLRFPCPVTLVVSEISSIEDASVETDIRGYTANGVLRMKNGSAWPITKKDYLVLRKLMSQEYDEIVVDDSRI